MKCCKQNKCRSDLSPKQGCKLQCHITEYLDHQNGCELMTETDFILNLFIISAKSTNEDSSTEHVKL